jgi:hypothetical protein
VYSLAIVIVLGEKIRNGFYCSRVAARFDDFEQLGVVHHQPLKFIGSPSISFLRW